MNPLHVIFSKKNEEIEHAENLKAEFLGLRGDFLPLTSALDGRESLISRSGRFDSEKMASCTSCVIGPFFFGFKTVQVVMDKLKFSIHILDELGFFCRQSVP